MHRSPVLVVLSVLLLAAFGGTAAAYGLLDKSVVVVVDGRAETVHTFAGDVSGVLRAAGLGVGRHDTVVPDQAAPVHDGSRIYLVRGRRLLLMVDGAPRAVWIDAETVAQALSQLGLRIHGEFLSAAASRSIPLRGLALVVRLPQTVVVRADGRRLVEVSTAPTVGALLRQLHIALTSNDQLNVPAALYPTSGLVIEVFRIRYERRTATVSMPFPTVTRDSASLPAGQQQVLTAGAPGVELIVYRVELRNGTLISRREMAARVLTAPQPEVLEVGTGSAPTAGPAPVGPVGSAASLNWAALAGCESGGNPQAVSPGGTYRGLYQFSLPTWASVGGTGDPIDASAAEQTYRAELLYERSGAGQWPVCGSLLFS